MILFFLQILTAVPSHPLVFWQTDSFATPQFQNAQPRSLHPDAPHLQPIMSDTFTVKYSR